MSWSTDLGGGRIEGEPVARRRNAPPPSTICFSSSPCAMRRHELVHAAAALVVVQLLVDGDGRLAGEIGVDGIRRDAALAVAGDAGLRHLGAGRTRPRQAAQQVRAPGDVGGRLAPWPRSSAARMAGEPGTMPTARQIAVNGSMPAPYPCTTGSTMKPKTTEKPRTPTMMRLAQRRQGRSSASKFGRLHAQPLPSTRCTMASGGFDQEELGDRDSRRPRP